MLKNLLDACGAALAFYVCGYGLGFGSKSERLTFLGNANFFLHGGVDRGFFFFQYAFSATAVTSTLFRWCEVYSVLGGAN